MNVWCEIVFRFQKYFWRWPEFIILHFIAVKIMYLQIHSLSKGLEYISAFWVVLRVALRCTFSLAISRKFTTLCALNSYRVSTCKALFINYAFFKLMCIKYSYFSSNIFRIIFQKLRMLAKAFIYFRWLLICIGFRNKYEEDRILLIKRM